jgi:hypothetical protein
MARRWDSNPPVILGRRGHTHFRSPAVNPGRIGMVRIVGNCRADSWLGDSG